MESEALQAFYTRIADFAALPVAWPNVDPAVQPTGSHYRVSVLNVDPNTFSIDGCAIYTWILQVAVYVRDGVGSIVSAGYADAIRAELPAGARIETDNYIFKTAEPCSVKAPILADGWFITPVQCRFITID